MPGLAGTVAPFESFLERTVLGQVQTNNLVGNHLPPAYFCMVDSTTCSFNPYQGTPPPAVLFRLPPVTVDRVSD